MCKGWLKKMFGGKKAENLSMKQPPAQSEGMGQASQGSAIDNAPNRTEEEENKEWR